MPKEIPAFALAVAMMLLAASAARALDVVTLQLKWSHQFQFAGYYAALEKGFYRDAGLQVEIREGGPNVDAIEDVVAGRADFGVGTSGALIARARGQNIVVLAAVFSTPLPFSLFRVAPGSQACSSSRTAC